MATKQELTKLFHHQFGRGGAPLQFFFAPGRVCLLGEHIDYNGGLVLPAAISRGIYGVMRPTETPTAWLYSTLDEKELLLTLDTKFTNTPHWGWANYPLGIIQYLKDKGLAINGFELLFHSDLPVGSGLSSSAAVEVLTAYIFANHLRDHSDGHKDLAKIGKRVENEFIGVSCGIMDQFAVAMGKKDHAILLDCDKLGYKYIPLQLGDYKLVILNTNKKRELVGSEFNTRAWECIVALETIQQHSPIKNLAQATVDEVKARITEPNIRKRALHVVQEHQRVIQAGAILNAGQIERFGEMLYASHQSLGKLYEVTGKELDSIVNAAVESTGCAGAKMSGAGFGGCAVALVKEEHLPRFAKQVKERYYKETGLQADIFPVEAVDGVGVMNGLEVV